ncbi:MAG: acyltransferase family protein [Bradyrhizobium sp.]
MQQTIAQPSDIAPERRVDLDWVRIGAFGLLILYHVGMFYVSWGWHIKSAHPVTELEPLMLALNPWRLALLFLVSGVATRFMLRKTAVGALMRSRSSRLLIPLIFGMIVIVPPQAWIQVVEAVGYEGGFVDFYLKYYFTFGKAFCPNPCIILPTWNHLWFVAYLWVYTMALGLVVMTAPGMAGWIERRLAPLLSGALLLVVPSVLFGVFRLALLPSFPSTHALFGDWYNHALFAGIFLLGFLLAHAASFWSAIERQRWIALGLAVAFYASWIWLRWVREGGMPLWLYAGFAYGFYQWLCIVAVLGFARRWLNRDSAVRRYLTDAIFPYYIVHQTAIIVIAHALRGSGISAGLEAAIILGGTAASCIVTFEIVRRVAWLRPLFGLKTEAAGPAIPMRASGQAAN